MSSLHCCKNRWFLGTCVIKPFLPTSANQGFQSLICLFFNPVKLYIYFVKLRELYFQTAKSELPNYTYEEKGTLAFFGNFWPKNVLIDNTRTNVKGPYSITLFYCSSSLGGDRERDIHTDRQTRPSSHRDPL